MSHTCAECKKNFGTASALAAHRESLHGVRSKKWMYAGVGAAVIVAIVVLILLNPPAKPGNSLAANLQYFAISDDPHLGDADASLVLIGYEAPTCSACMGFHLNILPDLQPYFDDGTLVYYYQQADIGYDFDRLGGIAQKCTYNLGGNPAFWQLTDLYYQRWNSYQDPGLDRMITQVSQANNLDETALRACIDGEDTRKDWAKEVGHGVGVGVRGTPTFFIFGETGAPEKVSAQSVVAAVQRMRDG